MGVHIFKQIQKNKELYIALRYFLVLLLITISIYKHQPPGYNFRASTNAKLGAKLEIYAVLHVLFWDEVK